ALVFHRLLLSGTLSSHASFIRLLTEPTPHCSFIKFLAVPTPFCYIPHPESGILNSESVMAVRNPACGIRNPESGTGVRNPAWESVIRHPESVIRHTESGIRNPAFGIRHPLYGIHPSFSPTSNSFPRSSITFTATCPCCPASNGALTVPARWSHTLSSYSPLRAFFRLSQAPVRGKNACETWKHKPL